MRTRTCRVYLLDGSLVKLHWRPAIQAVDYKYWTRDADAVAEVVKTTKKILIARITVTGKKPSPWFEITDKSGDTVKQLTDWWLSGAAISVIMLRE